jgi:undecaprenyl phosphate-alpha-L-ara4N flippase subunit ArnE
MATFIIWSTILSKIDLSVAVPVCSFSYVTIPLVSIIFLHEKISLLRWSGIFFILVGVIFVSLSSKEKETNP